MSRLIPSHPARSELARSRLLVLVAALLFSTGGPVIKASTLSAWQIACFRSFIAAGVLLLFAPSARRAIGNPKAMRRAILVGVAFGATMLLYVLANRLTTAANAIFLQDTAPLYVLVFAPLLLGEKARWRDAGSMLVLGAGLALILFAGDPPTATAPDPGRGNLLAAFAGISWALTVIGLRWLVRDEDPHERRDGKTVAAGDATGEAAGDSGSDGYGAVVAGNLLAALVALPFALPLVFSVREFLIVGYLGACQITLAYLFLNAGMRRVPAVEASLLLLLEPVMSAALGAWIHGERPGPLTLAGGILIILGTAARAWLDRPSVPERE